MCSLAAPALAVMFVKFLIFHAVDCCLVGLLSSVPDPLTLQYNPQSTDVELIDRMTTFYLDLYLSISTEVNNEKNDGNNQYVIKYPLKVILPLESQSRRDFEESFVAFLSLMAQV